MAAKKPLIPRKCVAHCSVTRYDSFDNTVRDVVHLVGDAAVSLIAPMNVVVATSVSDLATMVTLVAAGTGFKYLSIIDEGSPKHTSATTGKTTPVQMWIGTDILSRNNVDFYAKDLGKFDALLTDDAIVKIINCFVGADLLFHQKLAKAFNRPVIANAGTTSGFGLVAPSGYVRCDVDGTVRQVQ